MGVFTSSEAFSATVTLLGDEEASGRNDVRVGPFFVGRRQSLQHPRLPSFTELFAVLAIKA